MGNGKLSGGGGGVRDGGEGWEREFSIPQHPFSEG